MPDDFASLYEVSWNRKVTHWFSGLAMPKTGLSVLDFSTACAMQLSFESMIPAFNLFLNIMTHLQDGKMLNRLVLWSVKPYLFTNIWSPWTKDGDYTVKKKYMYFITINTIHY